MTTKTLIAQPNVRTGTQTAPITALVLGALLLFVSGFAGAEALHASTHDSRHATGFPCH